MIIIYPDSKAHVANMGTGGPHVGPMDLAIWVCMVYLHQSVTTVFLDVCYSSCFVWFGFHLRACYCAVYRLLHEVIKCPYRTCIVL